MVAVMGGEPEVMLDKALEALGGIGNFVKKGQKIVIKPNIGWDRSPELAGNTNPKLVKALVKKCLEAGASKVTVFDHTCDNWQKCYETSGIAEAVKEAGGIIMPANDEKYFKEVSIPGGVNLKSAKIHEALIEADAWINVPVLKNHGGANMKLYLASAAITYSLKFLLSSGIKKIHKPMVASSASIKWAPLTIGFPLISLVGISICYYLSMNGKIAAAFVLFSSGILLATNAVILILIDLTEKNNLAQEQQKTLNEQLRSQRANIDALSSAYATQRKMTHDFRHHIAALSGMLQGGETQQAQDYLAALQEQQTERALMVNTHNSAIDAVLNQKGYAAQKQHIDIQFEVNDLSPLQIELIDCTVVLGNLLDSLPKAGGSKAPH